MSCDFVGIKHNVPENQDVFIVHSNDNDTTFCPAYPPSKSFVVYIEICQQTAKAKAFDLIQAQDHISRQMTSYSVDKYRGGDLCSKCLQPIKGGPYDDEVIKKSRVRQSLRFRDWIFFL